ncbi:hypothetical protein [Sandarakinorhabdus sp.]|uniref:hypothetical protein n=1 Tax=Sandarakinorhabdus sp. TaxID=1916663 RepID=UPI0028A70618|nr:hypothetical protein [Sandarakinorhabdus sp.]
MDVRHWSEKFEKGTLKVWLFVLAAAAAVLKGFVDWIVPRLAKVWGWNEPVDKFAASVPGWLVSAWEVISSWPVLVLAAGVFGWTIGLKQGRRSAEARPEEGATPGKLDGPLQTLRPSSSDIEASRAKAARRNLGTEMLSVAHFVEPHGFGPRFSITEQARLQVLHDEAAALGVPIPEFKLFVSTYSRKFCHQYLQKIGYILQNGNFDTATKLAGEMLPDWPKPG